MSVKDDDVVGWLSMVEVEDQALDERDKFDDQNLGRGSTDASDR
jgi:hypothetical protein